MMGCEHVATVNETLEQEGNLREGAAHLVALQLVILLAHIIEGILLFLFQGLLVLVKIGEHTVIQVDMLRLQTIQVLTVSDQEQRDVVRTVHDDVLPPVVGVFLLGAARLNGHDALGIGEDGLKIAVLFQPVVELPDLLPVEIIIYQGKFLVHEEDR